MNTVFFHLGLRHCRNFPGIVAVGFEAEELSYFFKYFGSGKNCRPKGDKVSLGHFFQTIELKFEILHIKQYYR